VVHEWKFPSLPESAPVKARFFGRVPGVDVNTDRESALLRLRGIHEKAMVTAGFTVQNARSAEQVHGGLVRQVDLAGSQSPPPCDGLVTSEIKVPLLIYVADCAAIYLIDRAGRGVGLLHSGKKGTELNIATRGVEALRQLGCEPGDLMAVVSPCIRPPHYEIDFASIICDQLANAGVGEVIDSGVCTAAHPERYYSYRREKGHTGRMLAVLELEAA